jgi:NitT/TauT family transport system substrate-binding protein
METGFSPARSGVPGPAIADPTGRGWPAAAAPAIASAANTPRSISTQPLANRRAAQHQPSPGGSMRFITTHLIAALAVLTLAAGSLRAAEPLKIGYSDWPGWIAWEVAIQKGWFKEAGVDVEFVWMEYVPSMDAFAAGKLDGVGMTNGDALTYGANGTKAVTILVNDFSNGNDMIIAKPGINSVKELKGRKIGVEVNFVDHLLIIKALELNGMKESDVELVNVSTNDTPQALASGQVDAVGCWHPISGQALKLVPGSKPIFTSKDVPGLIYDCLYVSPQGLAAHKAEWAKVVQVWSRVVAYIADPKNEADALSILAARVGLKGEEYKAIIGGTHLLSLEENVKRAAPSATLDSFVGSTAIVNAFNEKYGVYKPGAAGDLKAYFDLSLTGAK